MCIESDIARTLTNNSVGYKELGKMDKDVYRIAGTRLDIEPELLDKPLHDDV